MNHTQYHSVLISKFVITIAEKGSPPFLPDIFCCHKKLLGDLNLNLNFESLAHSIDLLKDYLCYMSMCNNKKERTDTYKHP